MTRIGRFMIGVAGLCMLALAAGCEEEKPKVEYVSKAETEADLKAFGAMGPGTMGQAGPAGPGGISMAPASGVKLQWVVPAGWTRQPDAPVRYATFKFGPEGEQAELTVTSLPPAAADVLRNVKRWRGQLGLPETSDAEAMAGVSAPMTVDGAETRLIDILGPENPVAPPNTMMPGGPPPASAPANAPAKPLVRQRMLTAIMSRPSEVWFFKLLGPEAMVEAQKSAFVSFVQSVKFIETQASPPAAGGFAQMPPGSADPHAGLNLVQGAGAAGPGMGMMPQAAPPAGGGGGPAQGIDAWEVPANWQTVNSAAPFRVATFRVGGNKPGESAEIVITSFSGGIGTVLDNINRWRGQVGLAPVGDPKDQPAETLAKTAYPTVIFDVAGPESQPPDKRHIVVAMIIHGDQSWFVKLTGGHEIAAAQKTALVDFVRSLRFTENQTGAARE